MHQNGRYMSTWEKRESRVPASESTPVQKEAVMSSDTSKRQQLASQNGSMTTVRQPIKSLPAAVIDKPVYHPPSAYMNYRFVSSSSRSNRLYDVRKGDTLSSIARRFYGDKKYAQNIFAANRDLLANPNALQVGMTLQLP